MARPKQIPERPPLTREQIEAAKYTGSKEHKVVSWWGGFPGARLGKDGAAKRPKKQMTTICNLTSAEDREKATGWVRDALDRGQFKYCDDWQTYPKHIWHKDESGQNWFGFCINGESGEYKGWPVEEASN